MGFTWSRWLRRPVNWSNYPRDLQRLLNEDARAGNVEFLASCHAVWKRAKDHGDKRTLLRYIKTKQREAKRARKAWDAQMRN